MYLISRGQCRYKHMEVISQAIQVSMQAKIVIYIMYLAYYGISINAHALDQVIAIIKIICSVAIAIL